MTARRRTFTVALMMLGLMVLAAGPALAHYCTNQSKSDQSTKGWVLLDVSGTHPEPVATNLKIVGQGDNLHIAGSGFADIYLDVNDNGVVDQFDPVFEDIFLHASLPVSSLLAAGCDQAVESDLLGIC